ncbi:MAG: hypothetical protein IKM43_03960 [Clostridia bacterium]|nr:hypothetical protein [Clostridia bacterium]
MFGKKRKMKAEAKAETSKQAVHPTKAVSDSAKTSNCGGRCVSSKVQSTKASDMTSGSRSTKSCSAKSTSTKSCGGKCTKTSTKSCS